MEERTLLVIDALVNLILGVLLLAFPRGLVEFLGLPPAASPFYPNILGAVLFGIGLALLIGRFRPAWGGLGLGGAIAINLSGGVVLALWLLAGGLALPARGTAFLWALVLLLVVISGVEGLARARRSGDRV
jgi:hypothetical protein